MKSAVLRQDLSDDTAQPGRPWPTVVADAAMTESVIRAAGLRKSYGKQEARVDALIGVDLELRRGEVVGVLGPNGAGKTTLIEILEGLRTADTGEAVVLGVNAADAKAIKAVRHRMGVATQRTILPPLLTVSELVHLQAALFPVHRDPDALIDAIGLDEKRDARVQHLSGGQQQRLAVIMALVGNPDLVFLDEPTSQLDPQGRHAVWDLLAEQQRASRAGLLINTHQMEEAQRLCDRVLILDHGKIIAEGSPTELVQRHCPESVLSFSTSADADVSFDNAVVKQVAAADSRVNVRVVTSDVSTVVTELMQRQSKGLLTLADFRIEAHTLEDVFLKLTGRKIRD